MSLDPAGKSACATGLPVLYDPKYRKHNRESGIENTPVLAVNVARHTRPGIVFFLHHVHRGLRCVQHATPPIRRSTRGMERLLGPES